LTGLAENETNPERKERKRFMGLLNLLLSDPLTFVLVSVPLLYSVIIHELAHGWVAYGMGDQTARWQGRLSLNPLRHLDPIGTLMLFCSGSAGQNRYR
jgi:Zn-dependent protease